MLKSTPTLAALIATFACGGEDPIGPPNPIRDIDTLRLAVGDTFWVSETSFGSKPTWEVIDRDLAVVQPHDSVAVRVRATGVGTTRIGILGTGASFTLEVSEHAISIETLAAGNATCGLATNDRVYCWGPLFYGPEPGGALSTTRLYAPAPVPESSGLTNIRVGSFFACALTSQLEPVCWGLGGDGNLGSGADQTPTEKPVLAATSGGVNALAVGFNFACVLNSARRAECWGQDGSGQLGDGSGTPVCNLTPCRHAPTPVASSPVFDVLAAGSSHTCGVAAAGAVYCWGSNRWLQLGVPSAQLMCDDGLFVVECSQEPVLATDVPPGPQDLALGRGHSCALYPDGAVQCWGDGRSGQLGVGRVEPTDVPVTVPLPGPVSQLSAGLDHTCALTVSNEVWCWGDATDGQTGDPAPTTCEANGLTPCTEAPALVGALNGTIVSLAAGGAHTCVSTSSGEAYCWGMGAAGALGIGRQIAGTPIPASVIGTG